LSPEHQLTLLAARAVESSGSIAKLKRKAQPLFRGKPLGFVNLPLHQHVAKPASPHYS
jgi:hypothetical protein